MINDTKTDDITTVAELYDYMERNGFQFKFYDGFPKDEVDTTIKDIQDSNRRLILESTGLQQTLEDMVRQRQESLESNRTQEITQQESLQDLLDFHTDDVTVEKEDDAEALNTNFSEDTSALDKPITLKAAENKLDGKIEEVDPHASR